MSMETIHNRIYDGIIVGVAIRGTIAKSRIFRVSRGNGYYDAKLGAIYQDQYAYFVPSSINNPESEPYRRQWIAAVHKWNYDLTASQKKAYNNRANKGLHMSGYNLFMREAMKGLVDMYVDRGDPLNYDFEIGNFTQDNAWHTLDLSSIIPLGAKLILFDFDFTNTSANRHIELRKNGQSNNKNHAEVHTRVAAQDDHAIMVVAPDGNRIIEYKISTAGWSVISTTVRGWWT